MNVYLNALGLVCALGRGKSEVSEALFAGDNSGLRDTIGWTPNQAQHLGTVQADLLALPETWIHHDNHCNRLALTALHEIEADVRQAIERYGRDRIGVVLGTSTAGIEEATHGIGHYAETGHWPADYHYADQQLASPAEFLADYLDLHGPCYSISTACTSGARALMSAQRLLRMGVCDAVLCGGVDALARLPINGFLALGALDPHRCTPFSRHRNGINIGEGAALFLVTREPGPVRLLGAGASSDAHHMSSPDPNGGGARMAMERALAQAQLTPSQIDYLNLHGTATELNDNMESLALNAVFPDGVACSSTKSMTGHTLAAAGALEAAFCWLSLTDRAGRGRLPPHVWDDAPDPSLPALRFTRMGDRLPAGKAHACLMSNSFAFGGNNASLILASTNETAGTS